MSYRAVGDSIAAPCEVCGSATTDLTLRGGATLDRCPVCGHLRRDLTRAPAAHRDHAYGGEPRLDRVRLALTHHSLVRGSRPESVFEIGYGSGDLLRRFLDGGARVGGIDPDQLQVGVDPVVAEHGDLRVGQVEDLCDGEVSADLVVGIHVLEHVSDPAKTLTAALGAVRPGGEAVFLTPAADSLGLGLYGGAWWMLEDPTHLRFFSADSLARAARDAGFVHVRVDRPVLDSLSTDAASIARLLPGEPAPGGALSRPSVLAAAVLSIPVVGLARVGVPRLRPTLRLRARRAAR